MIIRCKFFFLWEDLVCRLVQFKTNRAFGGSEPTVVWIRLLLGVCVQFTNGTISYFVTFSLRCHWKFEQKRKKRHACSRSQLSWVIFFLIIHLYAFVVLWGGEPVYAQQSNTTITCVLPDILARSMSHLQLQLLGSWCAFSVLCFSRRL